MRHQHSWAISQFLHGEQGALLVASQLVSCAPSFGAKLYAASQTFDEARHVEVFNRYLQRKVGFTYPISRSLKLLLDKILTDARWDLKFIGMQIIIEGLALAAFNTIKQSTQDPVLRDIVHLVIRDEARHVTFGVNYLEEFVKTLTAEELEERAQFAYEACVVMRTRLIPTDVYREFGWPVEEAAADCDGRRASPTISQHDFCACRAELEAHRIADRRDSPEVRSAWPARIRDAAARRHHRLERVGKASLREGWLIAMYKVRTFNQIALKGLERFPRAAFEVGTEIADPHAILLRSQVLTAEHVTPNLRAVARAGAGVNNVPVDLCTERGVVVFNTPGANANSVKELVLAALLLSARDVLGGLNYVASVAGVADSAELNRRVESEKKRFQGEEIYGKTLGVVGLGAIGALVAEAGLRLGMKVLGYDPAISVEAAWRLPSDVQRMENLPTLLARSDYVTLHVPLLDNTRNMINAESLKSFRPSTVLLNFARQEIVDEAALAHALGAGRLARYFSDFPSPTLTRLPNVVATPHLGASTAEAEENCAVMAADQLIDFLRQRQHSQLGELPHGDARTHRRRPPRGGQSQRAEDAGPDPVGARESQHQRHRHDQPESRRRRVQPDRRGGADSGGTRCRDQSNRQRDERAQDRRLAATTCAPWRGPRRACRCLNRSELNSASSSRVHGANSPHASAAMHSAANGALTVPCDPWPVFTNRRASAFALRIEQAADDRCSVGRHRAGAAQAGLDVDASVRRR